MPILFTPGAPREGHFELASTVAQMSEEERSAFLVRHDTYWAT
jgi:hypothetical protein